MSINKVSQSIKTLVPEYFQENFPLFEKFLEYYYKSQEKSGLGQNILNQFLDILNIDDLNVNILDGSTILVESITSQSDTLVVENVDGFLETNGSILIGNEVIFYEKSVQSPSIALSPGVNYGQVKLKWINLFNPIELFDGEEERFTLKLQNSPISVPSAAHLLVTLYGRVLVPEVDYTIDGNDIVFTVAPAEKTQYDDPTSTSIVYLRGFSDNTIFELDDITSQFSVIKSTFVLKNQGVNYTPIIDEYLLIFYNGSVLVPREDYTLDGDQITFSFIPLVGNDLNIFAIEAPIPTFGSGAIGFSRVNDDGELVDVVVKNSGSQYRFEYPPKVSVKGAAGSSGASVTSLVNGIKSIKLINGGKGYRDNNPPKVKVDLPTIDGSKAPVIEAVVEDGTVTSINIISSGSGYTFIPRITFEQPTGAEIGAVTVTNGVINENSISIISGGSGYTTAPLIYIAPPTGLNGIQAKINAVLNDNGEVSQLVLVNAGQGYEVAPRVAVIQPTGAQVLYSTVDAAGRLIDIEILDGGSGYDDVPSVYIVDDRVDPVTGQYIGGVGAKASAVIFNGQITDINITNFGEGYSSSLPPKVIIQSPPPALASADIGDGEVTGFEVVRNGSGYQKCKFEGCARAASGLLKYTEEGNAVFSGSTSASEHLSGSSITCLDSVFVRKILDKYSEQYLPDVPKLDFANIDVRNAIRTIKTFYSTKGTSLSISYLFKLLYGVNATVSYPRDQIIKPSAATWSVGTVLRATLESGDPINIKDSTVQQFADIADTNVRYATALVENYLAIQTSEEPLYELVLSAGSIQGSFVVPYKTKLAEPITEDTNIITVDSTIGWPERNGEFVINGNEIVRYKEKSLNQFIECTRGSSKTTPQNWDSATEIISNFKIYLNYGTAQEVVLNIVGIVDAQQTKLTDTGSYYFPGDKLAVSKLGGTADIPQLKTWIYNVKKIVKATNLTFGGVNNRFATVTCDVSHGLLVGDQVTIYGANPTIYNGTFEVTSRDSDTVFQYQLPQPATLNPQGTILISVDLNKGKSLTTSINTAISPYTTNVQNAFFNTDYVYVASTGIPNYNIGPFVGSALLPGNQRKLNRFSLVTQTRSTKNATLPGSIATLINGVSVWSYKSAETKKYGFVKQILIENSGSGYDAGNPPVLTISDGGGSGATAKVIVDGSLTAVKVDNQGNGYTSSPLVSIVGGGGSGASATAIITKGKVSNILINNGGSGYTSKPEISIVGGGGSGATGTAVVRGPIKSVLVTDGGEDYTADPNVTLSSGVGAAAQPIISNGRIVSIAVISGGVGYTTAPEVTIQGEGFGAVARAVIDLDGENAGKVTSIVILNKGIGYKSGTTLINLTSIGQNAVFDAQLSEWTFNLEKTTTYDSARGSIFTGYNTQYGGEYAHVSNPQRLRYILGDNLFIVNDEIQEKTEQLEHSPILGWAFDGNPIYGPYAFSDPTSTTSPISRMRSSYALKSNVIYDSIINPYPARVQGPSLDEYPVGDFVEDYEYNFASGDLDQYNGRFCKTPDFPNGQYCYFITIDASADGNPVFPYIIGPNYNSLVDEWNLSASAIQQNIPTGVVRYRDPYENVDIDVERTPNASQNSITLENGDILRFEIEDENRDGIISPDETSDPDEILEEAPLQIFDYFPKVKFDSKVDIEVETTTKFEDASVTGFTVENPGQNYQVNDILIFDNTGTNGNGASARISRIGGEKVEAYTYEILDDKIYGTITTTVPHTLLSGDKIYVDYSPIMDNTNKTFVVRQFKGIEEIVVTQNGSGYNEDIPSVITVSGDGKSGSVESVVDSLGAISQVNITNSGNSYTSNPRLLISHPQIFKKAQYWVSRASGGQSKIKINDVIVTTSKQVYICGSSVDSNGNTIGFFSKLTADGAEEYSKTLNSNLPVGVPTNLEFKKMVVDNGNIWIVGQNSPNSSSLSVYNPDIILVKYTEAVDGLSASLSFQKAYAGISGSTRSDNITSLVKISTNRFAIGGFTNTNSTSAFDAFIGVIDTAGSFVTKRKLASATGSEKLTSMQLVDGSLFFTLETSTTSSSTNTNLSLGKVTVLSTSIEVVWIKEQSNANYAFTDINLTSDEYGELYVVATCRLKATPSITDSFWVGKYDQSGNQIWNYRYTTGSNSTKVATKSSVDIFGDLHFAYSAVNTSAETLPVGANTNYSGEIYGGNVKIKYDGTLLTHTKERFIPSTSGSNIEGFYPITIETDNSGDNYVFGQSYINRNEFVYDFNGAPVIGDATGNTAYDKTNHYTPTLVGTGSGANQALIFGSGYATIRGYTTTIATTVTAYIKHLGSALGSKLAGDWTFDMLVHKPSSIQHSSNTNITLFAIGDATTTTGGLWLGYDISTGKLKLTVTNNVTALTAASGSLESSQTNMWFNDRWQFIGLRKSGNVFTAYVNGIEVMTGTVQSTSLGNKDVYIGNQPGWGGVAGAFTADRQGRFHVDFIRLRSYAVIPSVPSDCITLPATQNFPLTYDWVDDAWFSNNLDRYDYVESYGSGIKSDKDQDLVRLVTNDFQDNTTFTLQRETVSSSASTLTISSAGYTLGNAGLQILDFSEATTLYVSDLTNINYVSDIWSFRNATVPSPGSQKLKAEAIVKNRYYFKVTNTKKIDNIQKLTINQAFNFTVGAKLVLKNTSGNFVNSGYIVKVDKTLNQVYLAVNNNSWLNDLNTGRLSTERFDEQTTFGIRGPVVSDTNIFDYYVFSEVTNTTPGTFVINLSNYGTPSPVGGIDNLDEYATFQPYSATAIYQVRINSISGTSPYIPGSVISLTNSNISFNAAYNILTITGLTAVTNITLTTNLNKILQVTAVSNTDQVYVITTNSHYLSEGSQIYVDGNPSQTVSNVVYDEYDGSFAVDKIISKKEFTYKLPSVAITSPSTIPNDVSIFIKSPNLKMYYGHQYIFDMSHSSLLGANLSFSKDSLNKLEYSFNSIERIGTPGIVLSGSPPSVKLKVDKEYITNISYYFDPSRSGDDSPISSGAFLDIGNSPYIGPFDVVSTSGGNITTGDNAMTFILKSEPEGVAIPEQTSYSTDSTRAVGPIANIRLVSGGGFYQRLPIVTGIESTRKIERVEIEDPGTEYANGTYDNVPIQGDGEGGLVTIIVDNTTDEEANIIPGQIVDVTVSSPGKNYTTAFIDVDGIPGILGTGLTGSGAVLNVVIPPIGTGASIFTKGSSVGKIKKLKNNNFGFDYTHDYTLRPEITFPVNAQLINTSVLSSIRVTNPGNGYSQPPAVIITGGGGSGAIAESTIRNGRLEQIYIKDPGSGYSSEPTVELKSSFNYIINLDLGLLQFAFPHGIVNGAPVTLNVVDIGDGAEFPLAAGSIGRLNGTTTYYAISGVENSLEDDQLQLALTESNAELGDAITFVNAGLGRQQLLTTSFGGSAEATVETSTFLEGELVYQGPSFATATATGYVSTNGGWQIGPRLLKITDRNGDFVVNEKITGVISKSSGTIAELNIAKGVLEIGAITKTSGQFIDDIGKPSEIVQRVQDSYYYQDFSYAIDSSILINDWKDPVIKNVHPASFKVFGQLSLNENSYIANRETDFSLTKSVELAREAIVPNIQDFTLVEPIYQDFNNTEVLFRQRRLTSSEQILTSTVQRLDDISPLFDGERISFPLTVDGQQVIANENQLMVILNGIAQTPGTSFEIQSNSIVFAQPPAPPAKVQYAVAEIEQIDTIKLTFNNVSGFYPLVGNTITGSLAGPPKLVVTLVEGNDVYGYMTQGNFTIGEFVTAGSTGFAGNIATKADIDNIGLYIFGETIRNLQGKTAKVEEVNLATGSDTPIAELRFSIGIGTTTFEVVQTDGSGPVGAATFVSGKNYQIGSELIKVTDVSQGSQSTTITVQRAQSGTTAVNYNEATPIYGTEIQVTNELVISKTTGTYQSTPGLFDIKVNDVIVAAGSKVVSRVLALSVYKVKDTNESIPSVTISDGSAFFAFLFNRITSANYPNTIIDDLSKSIVSLVDFNDNQTPFNTKFPSTEFISNNVLLTNNQTGNFEDEEFIRNYLISFRGQSGNFTSSDVAEIRKLSCKNFEGSGFFSPGQIIRSENSKAEVIGFNKPRGIVYLGKMGRSTSIGADFHTVVFNGNAKLSTIQKKFGTTSLRLDGDMDYLSISNTTEFDFVNYTLEAWIHLPDIPAEEYSMVFATTGANQYWGIRNVSGTLYLTSYTNTTVNEQTTGTGVSVGQWTHVAWSRSGNTIKSFINGNLVHTGTSAGVTDATGLNIGYSASYANQYEINAYIDEVRVSDTTRYTANFTPATGIFQGDTNTKLLLHLDGANNQTYTEDWSGVATWSKGNDFSNDSIRATVLANPTTIPTGFAGKTFRYLDAANLLLDNKEFMAREIVYRLENSSPFSPFSVPTGSQSCVDDVIDIVEELARDLRNGGNSYMWDASALYVNRTVTPVTLRHVAGEEAQTLWVYNYLIGVCQDVINNVFISVIGNHGLTQVTNATLTDSNNTITQLTPTNASYNPATGLLILTVSSHGLTTSNYISIDPESLTFTCTSDGNYRQLKHPRVSDTRAYNRVLPIVSTTVNTFTVNVGVSPADAQFTHTFVSAAANSVNVLNYSTTDCTDVKDTIANLLDILIDTITIAQTPNVTYPTGDYLGSLTRVAPVYEYLGAYVDAYYSVPFDIDQVNNVDDYIVTRRIDTASRNRFYDAANLIRYNREAIVDKTAYDMLQKYPELALTMPGNEDGDGSGTERCKTDLGLLLDAVAKDIQYGGNFNTVTGVKFYIKNNGEIQHVRLQLLQSLYAHERLGYYAKQAVIGDLTSANTDQPIIQPWGITVDAGDCQNVRDAIDTLISLANDILAPTGDRYRDAGNLLYFNKNYIAEEAVEILEKDFTYTLSTTNYLAFTYPLGGKARCQVDIKLIIDSIITDLITGGNANTVESINFYVTQNGGIEHVEDQLLATLYAFEKVKFLGSKAVNNLLYNKNASVTGDQYAALYTTQNAYRDNTITDSNGNGNYTQADCNDVVSAYQNLWDTLIDALSPSRDDGIYGGRILLFNKNYFKEEIKANVDTQFGAGTWTPNDTTFINQIADDIIHDITLTDTSTTNSTTAQPISLLREGVISVISLTNVGAGYQSTPTIQISDPGAGGIAATATANLSNGGKLTSIVINSAGSNFNYAPELIFIGAGTSGWGGSTVRNPVGGGISAVRYDGLVFDFRSTNTASYTLGAGCATVTNGTGSGTTGNFNAGKSYVKFGAGAGANTATINTPYDMTAYDTIRVYAIAGNNTNGGEAPAAAGQNLTLLYSIDNGATYVTHDTIIFGGDAGTSGINGQNQNYTNFATLNYVDIPIRTAAKTSSTRWRVQRSAGGTATDNYGLYRIGFIDTEAVFPTGVGYDFALTQNDTSTTSVDPTITINTTVFVESITITNRGKGYDPNNPPTVTFTGGNPTTGALGTATVVYNTTRFTAGSPVTNGAGGSATVLEDTGDVVYLGPTTGTAMAVGQTLTQGSVTAVIPTGGVGAAFKWFTNIANIQSINTAKNLTNLVESETFSTNLVTNSEFYNATSWVSTNNTILNNNSLAPDGTNTAISFKPTSTNGVHEVYRQYNITSFETYDSNGVRFDNETLRYDNGPNSTTTTQQFTISYFVKANGYGRLRLSYRVDTAATPSLRLDVNVSTGVVENFFTNSTFSNVSHAMLPYGNGWYRIYITASIPYGYSNIRAHIAFKNPAGSLSFAGNTTSGFFIWGSKININAVDGYQAVSGQKLFVNKEYNIKKYALTLLEDLSLNTLLQNLPSPSTFAGFLSYTNAGWLSYYDSYSIHRIVRNCISIIVNQLSDSDYYTNINSISGIDVPNSTYGIRDITVPLGGEVVGGDNVYALSANNYAEIGAISLNEAKIAKVYQRFRIDGDIEDGPFTMNEIVRKQGATSTVFGVVYGFHTDDNDISYIDVISTGTLPFTIGSILVGDENGTTCSMDQIENRLHIIELLGDFEDGQIFEGYTSNATAQVVNLNRNEAAALDNTGGRIEVDTESLVGEFEKTAVVYAENTRLYIDTAYISGTSIEVGDRIISNGHNRIGINITGTLNEFAEGGIIYKLTNGVQDINNTALITEVDLINNYLYIYPINGSLSNGDTIVYYGLQNFAIGQASISTVVVNPATGSALVENIITIGTSQRLFLSNVIGEITLRDGIIARNYVAGILDRIEVKGRVKRATRGFDGVQTTFDLTFGNGEQYFPDPAGHLLIFINGTLQPPGATNAFTAFSDKIQFTEPPSLGSSFTGFYVGKLRQLDDISSEFDSLRQSFNLKRNGIFYSLTLTEGIQSTSIKPENNIIVSVNGVIQEPGVGFEIVGSRIIFTEIPRVGSTFVAFSYVGSEADVDAAEVVPPIEAGDFISIQGETTDREVAVIESSNSLITFDYLGSIFGKGAQATCNLTSGYISNATITAGGSGYTSRPTVRIDSITGFEAEIKALVGVSGISVVESGTGYQNPSVVIETLVDDDWVSPDPNDYPPEIR